jgi:hypothetical protein
VTEWPKTLKDAVDTLIESMSKDELHKLAQTQKEDLITLHHGWGTAIRNQFGLWRGNDELLRDCGETHPDDASMVIIKEVWLKSGSSDIDKEASSI